MQYKYNYTRDKADERDIRFSIAPEYSDETTEVLPKTIDLRPKCPPVYTQGELGSCTANAACTYRIMLGDNSQSELSRLFLYYMERNMQGNTSKDTGASLRDACKSIYKYGICEEKYMPYDINKFAKRPPKAAFLNAQKYRISAYKSLNSLYEIKINLAFRKKPVLLGMDVHESMESEIVMKTGLMPMPKKDEKKIGAHAVLVVGYKDISKTKGVLFKKKVHSGYLIVRNSWGPDWGDNGYFYMPYDYVKAQYTYDYWIIE